MTDIVIDAKLISLLKNFFQRNGKLITKLFQSSHDKINLENLSFHCLHNGYKYQCKICKGSSICQYSKQRHECTICSREYYLNKLT